MNIISPLKTIFFIFIFFTFSISFSQVGIGTTTPTETLHVNGNIRIDGALMPNNIAGSANQILVSGGAGNSSTWGPEIGTNINDIEKWFVPSFNSNNNTFTTINIADPKATSSSQISFSLVGPLPAGAFWGYDFTILAEATTGTVTFYVTNVSGSSFTNLQIVYTAHY